MFKKLFLFNIFLLSFLLISCSAKTNSGSNNDSSDGTKEDEEDGRSELEINMTNYIDNLIKNTSSFVPSWNKESFKNRWNYIDGVFLKSIIDLYKKTNDKKYIDFVVKYTDYYINSNGDFVCPDSNGSNQTPFLMGELDSICESRILFDLYEYTNKSKYLTAIDYSQNALSSINKISSGNYWHKETYPNQVWLDGMYMYVPFQARNLLKNNDSQGFDTLKQQYKFIRDHMFDESKKLYYHGYDDSGEIFWANSNGCSSSFWLRGMGWYITSLADLLEYVPKTNSNREYFVNLFKEAIDGVLQYKDNDSNMFYQVVDKAGLGAMVSYYYLSHLKNKDYQADAYINNYLESSGSSLIAYCILKGVNLNVLSEDYRQIGLDIFNGVYNHSFSNNQLNDICIQAGLGPADKPYRDGSFEYYLAEPVGSNDAKGVGPFIMAYIQQL